MALSDDDFIDETVTDAAIVHHCRSKTSLLLSRKFRLFFLSCGMPGNWKVPMRRKLDEDIRDR